MKHVNPYLNFLGTAEEAFRFYHSVFGGDEPMLVRYREMGMDGPEGHLVAHVSLPIGASTMLMASDVPESRADTLHVGTNVEIYIATDDMAEGQRLFDALSDDGEVVMPFEKTAWSERFGSCVDRFGIRWSVDYTGEGAVGQG